MQKNAIASGKIYTAVKNFTQTSAMTVATNFNSGLRCPQEVFRNIKAWLLSDRTDRDGPEFGGGD